MNNIHKCTPQCTCFHSLNTYISKCRSKMFFCYISFCFPLLKKKRKKTSIKKYSARTVLWSSVTRTVNGNQILYCVFPDKTSLSKHLKSLDFTCQSFEDISIFYIQSLRLFFHNWLFLSSNTKF